MYKVIIHSRAEQDLMDIFLYITEYLKAPDTAQHLYSKIKQQISTLESMPYQCSLVSDEPYQQLGIRKQFVDNYIVFFVVKEAEKEVHVFRILYGKREWRNLL